MKARIQNTVQSTSQEFDTVGPIKELLKGQSAEIYAMLDPETGKVQVAHKCATYESACLLLAQLIESMARKGLPNDLIRSAVELGLDYRNRN